MLKILTKAILPSHFYFQIGWIPVEKQYIVFVMASLGCIPLVRFALDNDDMSKFQDKEIYKKEVEDKNSLSLLWLFINNVRRNTVMIYVPKCLQKSMEVQTIID